MSSKITKLNEFLNKEQAEDACFGSSILLLFPGLARCIFSSPAFSEKFLLEVQSGIAIIGLLLLISLVPWLRRKRANSDLSEQSSCVQSIEELLGYVLFFVLPFIPIGLFCMTVQIMNIPLSLRVISNVGISSGGVIIAVIAFILLIQCEKKLISNTVKAICFFMATCVSIGISTLIIGTMQKNTMLQMIGSFGLSSPAWILLIDILFNVICRGCKKLKNSILDKGNSAANKANRLFRSEPSPLYEDKTHSFLSDSKALKNKSEDVSKSCSESVTEYST